MKKEKRPPLPNRNSRTRDVEIDVETYATMPLEEVNARLAEAKVDAEEIVRTVKRLVHEKLEEWAKSGPGHSGRRALHAFKEGLKSVTQRSWNLIVCFCGPAAHLTRLVACI
ncbi:MAG TPA: hypothetical protein VHW00_11855 [Thermoanaerobaculia bacterium]|nr:hypothetical protein [Thermoanaerobaculia bacterium]